MRQHWVAVLAIALVMAIGIGVYGGLGSTATWRRVSNDESFASLGMHDLQVSLSPGIFVDEGTLVAVAESIDAKASVVAVAERLVVDNQVDASTDAESILVAARVVGMDVADDSGVDNVWIRDGEPPGASGTPERSAVLEAKFADSWGLPTTGSITLAGGHDVTYVGLGMIAEDFFYEGPEGSILSEGELAPVYMPLAAAQEVIQRPGQINDLVLTLSDDADRDLIEVQLTQAVAEEGMSATVSTRDDATAVRVLYDDIENDQRFWNALAALVLGAAALAAFNLISRIVEAQRREIGIGMALGVPRWKLAARPLMVGVQVGLLGTIAGIGVGLVVGQFMANLMESFVPLPIWRTSFQFDVFAQAAILGLTIPIVASALPLWRALRVEPIEAIRTGHLAAKSSRLTDWTGRISLPGSSLTQIPIRNVLRTPRRTLLTAAGVAAAITALVAVLGMLDSFGRTIDRAGGEFTKGEPGRVLVQLDTFYPADSSVVQGIVAAPTARATDVGLRLPGSATSANSSTELDLLVDFVDFESGAWTPTLESSTSEIDGGIILARKAADDLGVAPGDRVVLQHPVLRDSGSFVLVDSDVTVTAIHANPLRTFAYMDLADADLFGLGGVVNLVHAYPRADTTSTDLQRAVFDLPGVTSSQAVARISEGLDEALAQFVGFLVVTAVAALVLALLMAFNATRITVEERRREHATMRAFGLPVRSIVGVVVKRVS